MTDDRDALTCRVPAEHDGLALADFLVARFTYHDAANWRRRVDDGLVLVDGRAASAAAPLTTGARVEYRPALDDDLIVDIVHAEDGVVVIDKPAGAVCHRTSAFAGRTFVRRAEARIGRPLEFAHRLDRGTRGLVVLAEGRRLAEVVAAFADRAVEKEYRARVVGQVAEDSFVVDAPLGPDRAAGVAGRRWLDPDGRPALTACRVLARDAATTELAVFPRTGRTHQIRVHLASIGHPVVGDALYAADWRVAYPRALAALDEGHGTWHQLAHVRLALQIDGRRREFALPT